jgi:hypothetical protein
MEPHKQQRDKRKVGGLQETHSDNAEDKKTGVDLQKVIFGKTKKDWFHMLELVFWYLW